MLQALYQWQIGGGELADIEEQFRAEFSGKTPYLILNGPVCRPGWLIEIDATAVVPAKNGFPDLC